MRYLRFQLPGTGSRLGLLTKDDQVMDFTEISGGKYSSLNELLRESLRLDTTVANLTSSYLPLKTNAKYYKLSELLVTRSNSGKPYLLLPLEPSEVWAAGVTYQRSVEARMAESQTKNIYDKVYEAERPEIFFKSIGNRVVGPGGYIGVRKDSKSIVPEPELGVIIDERSDLVGYIIGNDITARDIEGENPLYLPQAKIFNGACSLGPIVATPEAVKNPYDLGIKCEVIREGSAVFTGEANTSQLKRNLEEMVGYLAREYSIKSGTVLLTGTAIVPPDSFTLEEGDIIRIEIDHLGILYNTVSSSSNCKDPT